MNARTHLRADDCSTCRLRTSRAFSWTKMAAAGAEMPRISRQGWKTSTPPVASWADLDHQIIPACSVGGGYIFCCFLSFWAVVRGDFINPHIQPPADGDLAPDWVCHASCKVGPFLLTQIVLVLLEVETHITKKNSNLARTSNIK